MVKKLTFNFLKIKVVSTSFQRYHYFISKTETLWKLLQKKTHLYVSLQSEESVQLTKPYMNIIILKLKTYFVRFDQD